MSIPLCRAMLVLCTPLNGVISPYLCSLVPLPHSLAQGPINCICTLNLLHGRTGQPQHQLVVASSCQQPLAADMLCDSLLGGTEKGCATGVHRDASYVQLYNKKHDTAKSAGKENPAG